MADDSKRIFMGDDMEMDTSLSQNRVMRLKNQGSQMVGRETSMSCLDKGATRTEPRTNEPHTNLVQLRRSQANDQELASLGRMTTNEADDGVRVSLSTYKRYIMNYYGGWKFIILSNISIIVFTQVKLYNDYLLGVWAQNTGQEQHEEFYFYS